MRYNVTFHFLNVVSLRIYSICVVVRNIHFFMQRFACSSGLSFLLHFTLCNLQGYRKNLEHFLFFLRCSRMSLPFSKIAPSWIHWFIRATCNIHLFIAFFFVIPSCVCVANAKERKKIDKKRAKTHLIPLLTKESIKWVKDLTWFYIVSKILSSWLICVITYHLQYPK